MEYKMMMKRGKRQSDPNDDLDDDPDGDPDGKQYTITI